MVSVNISVPWQLPMVFVDKQIPTSGSCVSFDFEYLLDPAMQSIYPYALSIRNDASLYALSSA